MATIEERITNVLRTAKASLSLKEMTEKQYDSFIENLLVSEKLVVGTRQEIENSELPYEEKDAEKDLVFLMRYDITNKLNVIKSYGVQNNYRHLKNTSLTENTKKDVELYAKLLEKLKERLAPQARDKTFTEKEYSQIVKEVGEPLFTEYDVDVSEERRNTLLMVYGAIIKHNTSLGFNINIVSAHREEDKRFKSNGLTKKQLQEIIEKAVV